MSNAFFGSNGPQRQSEPRMSDERNRDFGGAPSRGAPDQGAADRRDAGADQLLELARLIGQSDPFAPEASKTASMSPASMSPASMSPASMSPASVSPGAMADGRLANVSRAAAQATAARDPFAPPPPPPPAQDRSYDERSYEERGRHEPDFGEPRVPVQSGHPDGREGLDFLHDRDDYPVAPRHGADERDYDRGGRRQQAYGHEGHPDEYRDGEYEDGEYGEPEDYDEDERGAKRRRPARMVIAVLGLAVFGGAAAFGYRAVFNTAPSGPTPIIRADNSPTKMTPMSEAKQETGRIGDRIGEQLGPRAEEPVDVGAYRPGNDIAGQVPQDTAGGFPPNMPNMVPATPGAVAPPADAKRVQTIAISADAGTSSRNPSRGAGGPVQPAQPQSPSRQATASPPPSQPSPPPSPPPQRQAALAPTAADTTAAVAPTVDSGGYVVQLSAVRSEADAQTAFRQLQVKYPVLSGRQPLIRRKDQGERGIFFATQVGPFGAKSDADQLCEQLKSAGGSCFVQRN
jgi:cell division septation protein DedD